MTWWTFLLVVGSTGRLSRLIARDTITGFLRSWVIRRFGPESKVTEGIGCVYCVSVWVAFVAAPVGFWFGDRAWFTVPAVALSASLVASLAIIWVED